MESFVVKKLGGENAAEMFESARNVINDAKSWVQQAVVISAMRSSEFNTTDELIKIWNAFHKKVLILYMTPLKKLEIFIEVLLKKKYEIYNLFTKEVDRVLEERTRKISRSYPVCHW